MMRPEVLTAEQTDSNFAATALVACLCRLRSHCIIFTPQDDRISQLATFL